MRRWCVLALTLVVILLFGALTGRGRFAAQAADLWNVQVSGDVAADGIMGTTYFPEVLNIHIGDTVVWTWATTFAPHTVTFPSGAEPPPPLIPGPDPGSLQAGPGFFPIGVGPDNSGTYDGTQVANSGVPADPTIPPFQLTFTAPGIYPYICLFHPGMHGTITVLPSDASLVESPAQAFARGQADFNVLADDLRNTIAAIQSTSLAIPGGVTLHTVAAGVSHPAGMTALRFLPDSITVRRGDLVSWTIADPFELHTITFTSGTNPPGLLDVRPQPSGAPLIVIPTQVFSASGGTTYAGAGFVNSGFLAPGQSFGLRIDAPPGTYDYLCLIHGPNPMKGTITVTP